MGLPDESHGIPTGVPRTTKLNLTKLNLSDNNNLKRNYDFEELEKDLLESK